MRIAAIILGMIVLGAYLVNGMFHDVSVIAMAKAVH